MNRVAIVGGGISGVAAAYEVARLAKAGAEIECTLFEASDRLGGTVKTLHVPLPGSGEFDGEFLVELGPDGWVSEKPWARELAIELGLEGDLLPSNDAERRTLLLRDGALQAFPDGMRMMVPLNDDAVRTSNLLSETAKQAYVDEPGRAEELRTLSVDTTDITVADFVRRHFGEEVTRTFAGPLLAGVFGGDIEKLSARSVMPSFLAMERVHGSLINALRARATATAQSKSSGIFTAMRGGNESLIQAMVEVIPPDWIRLQTPVQSISRSGDEWTVTTSEGDLAFDAVMLSTPAHVTRKLLHLVDANLARLHTIPASSGIMVGLLYTTQIELPRGFGFLVQQPQSHVHPALLAATFSHQKYPHSVPAGCMLLRVFFGGVSVTDLDGMDDADLARLAEEQMQKLFPDLPTSWKAFVQRWPHSLPQYELGHEERVREIEQLAATLPGLALLGNAYRGVGLPDMVHRARTAAHSLPPE